MKLTLCKEDLELSWQSNDLRFEGVRVRQAYNAGKSDDWANCLEQFLGNGKLSVWTSAKVRECYNEVVQEDEGPQHCTGFSAERHDFLEADHRASRRTGRSHLVVCPHAIPA